MEIRRCQHIKTNGQQCGSPAMRAATVCYFHGSLGHTQHLTINQAGYYPSPSPETLTLPVLEDYESVQMAIMQVLQKLTTGHLDSKTAGLLLYGLQIASSNLRYARFDPRAETVVIDPTATHLTPLDGDQWSDQEDEENYDEEEDDGEDDEEDLNEELGNEAELEATEQESSAGVPPATVRAPSPCTSSVGAAASPPAISNPIAGVKKSSPGFDVQGQTAEAKSKPEPVGADAPVRPGAERGKTEDRTQPQEEEPPRISDAQFFQALANLCDHRENGTPLKFPVYPAHPPASLDSGTNGKRRNGNGSS